MGPKPPIRSKASSFQESLLDSAILQASLLGYIRSGFCRLPLDFASNRQNKPLTAIRVTCSGPLGCSFLFWGGGSPSWIGLKIPLFQGKAAHILVVPYFKTQPLTLQSPKLRATKKPAEEPYGRDPGGSIHLWATGASSLLRSLPPEKLPEASEDSSPLPKMSQSALLRGRLVCIPAPQESISNHVAGRVAWMFRGARKVSTPEQVKPLQIPRMARLQKPG